MTDLCRNCCKTFCENRNRKDIFVCNEKFTFVQSLILDKPKRIEGVNNGYRNLQDN